MTALIFLNELNRSPIVNAANDGECTFVIFTCATDASIVDGYVVDILLRKTTACVDMINPRLQLLLDSEIPGHVLEIPLTREGITVKLTDVINCMLSVILFNENCKTALIN